ncbi:MAG: retropepsin-like domain-containing protein [Phycisphaerales bacterium]|nr:retropepsin-like domain-containing protein [Phycisphaerales bacterium]
MSSIRVRAAVSILSMVCWAAAMAQGVGSGQSANERPAHSTDQATLLRQGSVAFDETVAAALEVRKAKTGHLLVRPTINGHAAGWFIFDTGAGVCVVSTERVESLELERTGEIDSVGAGGGQKSAMYRARELRLGPVRLADLPMMGADLSFLEPHLGEKIDGVVGYGLLSRCVAELDVSKPSIALHDPAKFRLERGEWTKLDLRERVPVVEAKFEGHEGKFLLDTGSHSHLTFNEPAVREWNLLEGRTLTDGKLGGVGGFVAAKNGTIARLEFAGATRTEVPASFAIEARGTHARSDRAGTIGGGLLAGSLLIVDYAGARLAVVEPRPEKAAAQSGS